MAMLWTISIMTTVCPSGAAEHPHLATAGEGNQKIDNLETGFQNLDRSVLLHEGRSGAMDRIIFVGFYGSQAIHRFTDHIQNPAQTRGANRNQNGLPRIPAVHSSNQTIGGIHGDTANHIIAQMLGNLDD